MRIRNKQDMKKKRVKRMYGGLWSIVQVILEGKMLELWLS